MTCNEVVSQGGTTPKYYNTSNLRKHLQSHNKEYKEFCEKEAAKNEESKLKKASLSGISISQVKLNIVHEVSVSVLDLKILYRCTTTITIIFKMVNLTYVYRVTTQGKPLRRLTILRYNSLSISKIVC